MVNRPLTVGVEEEFFTIDPRTRGLLADSRSLLGSAHARVPDQRNSCYAEELRPCMIESRTGVCRDLSQVRAEIRTLRAGLVAAASATGSGIAAAGTFPPGDWRAQGFVPKPRFEHIAKTYAQLAEEQVICACHIHVGVGDRDLAILVMIRVTRWLPVLAALSSSSPFWMGRDTGYASWRAMVWERRPSAGIPPTFRSYGDYRRGCGCSSIPERAPILVRSSGATDVRPGTRYETVEFRVADSCPSIDETVIQAGLSRALVQQCLDEVESGVPALDVRPELLRAAKWRASRFGLTDTLIDPVSAELVPAELLVGRLFQYVRDPLEEARDWDEMTRLVERTKHLGTSAQRQRQRYAETGRLDEPRVFRTA